MIYLIEAECWRVKIGFSERPISRFQTIAAASPVRCHLIALLPGGKAEEQALHRRFAPYRVHREWFTTFAGEFRRFVDANRGVGVPDLPEWVADLSLPDDERSRNRYERAASKMRAKRRIAA